MIVYFRNSKGEDRVIGHASNYRDVNKIIKNFLEEKNFKSYYTRNWENDNKKQSASKITTTNFANYTN